MRARPLLLTALLATLVAILFLLWPPDDSTRRSRDREAPLEGSIHVVPGAQSPGDLRHQGRDTQQMPTHDRVLQVRVVAAPDGQPIPAAEVWATTDDLAVHVQTGADGRAQLPVSGLGVSFVAARKEGYRLSEVTHIERVDFCEVVLVPAPVLRGRVVRAGDGAPLAGARVWISDRVLDREFDVPQTTDEEGRFVVAGVPEGAHFALGVAMDGYGNRYVTGRGGHNAGEILVRLGIGLDVLGVVRNSEGRPAVGVRVLLHPNSEQFLERSPLADTMGQFSLRRSLRATTDAGGGFAIRGVDPGVYCLRAWGQTLATARIDPVSVEGEDVRLDVLLEQRSGVILSVAYPGGKPAAGAVLRIEDANGEWVSGPRIPYRSDEDGETLLGPLDPGRYTLRVSPHRRLPVEREVNVEAGRLSRVEVEARPGLRLEGMVNDARGRPLGGIDLNFWVKSAPRVLEHYVRAESDSDGRFVFEGLQAAPGDLEASDWGGWYEVWRESGATPGSPLAITLRDTARVTGRVEPAPSSRRLSYVLRTENSIAGAGDLALDADGRFVLRGLPAGIPITLAFDPPNGQPALRELTPLARGEERDLGTIEVVAGGTFRGRIRDEAGRPFAWIRVRMELEKYTLIRCALTDQAGEFLVENMPQGRVVVFFMDQETSGRGYRIGDWSSKVHHEFELPR